MTAVHGRLLAALTGLSLAAVLLLVAACGGDDDDAVRLLVFPDLEQVPEDRSERDVLEEVRDILRTRAEGAGATDVDASIAGEAISIRVRGLLPSESSSQMLWKFFQPSP